MRTPPRPSFASLGFLVSRARLVADVDAVESAAPLVAQLRPYAGQLGIYGSVACAGPVGLQLGRLEALLGRRDAAIDLLSATLERCRAEGLPGWVEAAAAALAAVLGQGDPGDGPRISARGPASRTGSAP